MTTASDEASSTRVTRTIKRRPRASSRPGRPTAKTAPGRTPCAAPALSQSLPVSGSDLITITDAGSSSRPTPNTRSGVCRLPESASGPGIGADPRGNPLVHPLIRHPGTQPVCVQRVEEPVSQRPCGGPSGRRRTHGPPRSAASAKEDVAPWSGHPAPAARPPAPEAVASGSLRACHIAARSSTFATSLAVARAVSSRKVPPRRVCAVPVGLLRDAPGVATVDHHRQHEPLRHHPLQEECEFDVAEIPARPARRCSRERGPRRHRSPPSVEDRP